MTGSIVDYVDLITSEHNQKPLFVAAVSALVQGFADAGQFMLNLPAELDLDEAIGVQLDATGSWVGRSRTLDPTTASAAGVTTLQDSEYRALLKGSAMLNSGWDGSWETAGEPYQTWFKAYNPAGVGFVEDLGDLSIKIGLAGFVPGQVLNALFVNGYIQARPAGVMVRAYVVTTGPGPVFGLGAESDGIAGLGSGYWGKFTPSS